LTGGEKGDWRSGKSETDEPLVSTPRPRKVHGQYPCSV
jgi:hypothetical protein